MKKIVFLIAPEEGGRAVDRIFGCNFAHFFQHNIFILYPATVLKEVGFVVSLIDCPVERLSLKEALKEKADAYVIYGVFLSEKVDLATVSQIEKIKGSKTPIVFMGPGPTHFPQRYLTSPNRIVVRGEPETTTLELFEKFDKDLTKIAGLSMLKDGKIYHTPHRPVIEDLDTLPFPDRTLYKRIYEYNNAKFKKFPTTTTLTSRGCSFRCYYCVPNSQSYAREMEEKRYFGRKPFVKKRSVKNVTSEFKKLKEMGFFGIEILDDQFLWDRKRTIEMMEGIKNLSLEIALLARCDMLTDLELAKKLYAGGVRHISFGVESFSQEILDDIKKDVKVENIFKAVEFCKRVGISPEINILLGSTPLETEKTLSHTLKMVESLGVDVIHVNIASPYPATEFYEKAKKEGWITTGDYIPTDTSAAGIISYRHLTREELERWVRKFYRTHYFSPKYILRQLSRVHSPKELSYKIQASVALWRNIFKV